MAGRQRLAVLLLLGTSFMLSVDFSIMNVALPVMGAGVGLNVSELPWVVSAYALPAAGFTLLFGRITDLFGRRRMFLTGSAGQYSRRWPRACARTMAGPTSGSTPSMMPSTTWPKNDPKRLPHSSSATLRAAIEVYELAERREGTRCQDTRRRS